MRRRIALCVAKSPGSEHSVRSFLSHPNTESFASGIHKEPDTIVIVQKRFHTSGVFERLAFTKASKLFVRNRGNIVKIIPKAPKNILGFDPSGFAVFDQIGLGIIPCFNQGTVWMPERNRKRRAIGVSFLWIPFAADPADHIHT